MAIIYQVKHKHYKLTSYIHILMLCTTTQEIESKKKPKLHSYISQKVDPIPSTKTLSLHQPRNHFCAMDRLLLGLLSILFLMQRCHAFQFKVGGSQGWSLPSDPNASIYNHWAEKNRFQIHDSLLFVYSSDHDSVLLVTKEDYNNCSTENPLKKFTDGHTVYEFKHSGPHYFISGEAENCQKNEKLIVVVMADRSKNASVGNGTVESPSPAPSGAESPSTSPPSPAPSGEESPSPPSPAPSGEESQSNPAPAPSEESSPPKNGASSVVAGVVGLLFASSSLVLAV